MRVLRLVGLVASVAAVYFANYIFQQRSLSEFFPAWALQRIPTLYTLARWLPEDLLTLAFWLSLLAALSFGLVATSWPAHVWVPPRLVRFGHSNARVGGVAILVALLCSVAAPVLLIWQGSEGLSVQVVWGLGVLLYLLGCVLVSDPPPRFKPQAERAAPRPERSWPQLLMFLIGFCLLWGWQWWTTPPLLDPTLAGLGLAAQTQYHSATLVLFSAAQATSPLATSLLALLGYLSGDMLLAFQLTGLLSGLLCLAATWLLGCELFRRRPRRGQYEEALEDQGQWVALIAVTLLGISPVFFYLSQRPIYLEPVAWGLLGLWSLLRGLRGSDRLSIGLSGVLIAWATLLYTSGVVFLPIALGWWAGIWLLQPGWLQSSAREPKRLWPMLSLFWLGGLWITLAPQLVLWLQQPTLFLGRFIGKPLPDINELLMLFHLGEYRGPGLDFPSVGLSVVIAPLLLLALGNLLLNLDRLVGWLLFVWTISGLVIGSLLAPQAQFWPTFLPLLPALVLSLALMLDRLRLTWLETAGTWATQATSYLIIGLLIWAGLLGWLDYDDFRRTAGDAISRTAQQLTTLNTGQTVFLVQGEAQPILDWESAALQFVAQTRFPTNHRQVVNSSNWPNALPGQSTFVVQAADQLLLTELQTRYPGGQTVIRRDQLGNPTLYLYQLQ